MTDELIEKAKFVRQLFRECDAIQLPHKPTEEVLTGLIDHIEAEAEVIKAAEALAEAMVKCQRIMENRQPDKMSDGVYMAETALTAFRQAQARAEKWGE